MDGDNPELSVGFAIDFHDSFGQLRTLDDILGETAAAAVREFKRIEQATAGAINMGGATASITSFGNAATRELANVRKETNNAEKAAEGMIRQIERQVEVFGKSASEIRQMRAEMKAARAEELGLADAATRLRAASAQMDMLEASTGRLGVTTGRTSFAMKNFALQGPDIAQGLLTGQKPMTIFIQQGGQIAQVAMMAEGGLKGFGAELGALALRFSPLLVAAAAVGAGFELLVRWVNQGVTNNQLTRDLGDITGGADATKAELYKLRDATVTWGDVSKALFSEVGKDIANDFVGDMQAMSKDVKAALDDMTSYGKTALAGLYAGFAGTRAYLAEIGTWKGLRNLVTGDPTLLDRTYGDAYRKADDYLTKLGARVKKAAMDNARTRLAATIGYNNIPKPKVDHHAEQLARDAAATEAQIKNLYTLADAYGVSGAAALIAAAREKAESQAIKQRADIDAAVARQVRLAIAEQVKSTEAGAAAMRDQATVQGEVNKLVAAGVVPASQAADLVRDRMADLPILTALQAAQAIGDQKGITATTKALADQRAAREQNNDAIRDAQQLIDLANAGNALDQLKLEGQLINANAAARVHALATLKAEQDAIAKHLDPAQTKDFVAAQVAVADQQEVNRQKAAQMNEELQLTAQLTDDLGTSFSKAFGKAGDAIGDAIRVLGQYGVEQERIAKEVQEGNITAAAGAKLTANAQMNGLIDLTDAAKGLFKEHSKGYDAMMAAEKALTIVQLARTAVDVAGGAARMFASLGPFAFPAVAAMLGVMASLGFSGGGKSASYKLPDNTGTGTVLGDASAQSASIKNAIDALKEVDTLTSIYARDMSASLKSIDSAIGGFAALITRSGDISASAGVTEGFKTNAIGSVLKAVVPIFGGALASLFGTKTKVTASGLYGSAQSIGSILNGGFDASYYSDIEKTHKFLGITTGHSYKTQFGAADPTLENQFTLILKQFDDAIVAAAGPLGAATSDIQNRLNGFVVNLGKIDLTGLTGQQIQDKLEAVFGAAADNMADAAFPGIERFQKVGEGAFETLVRVASTVEAVTNSLAELGDTTKALGIDAKMGLANQFDSLSDMTSAIDAYFQAFYSTEEQTAAKTAQLTRVFDSLGLTMPNSLAAFRQLVEAQDLTTAAGEATYATLIKLAPAFADLESALNGAKSAADIASEHEDLTKQLLELQGDTAALRAMELAAIDPSNRALQQQIWAIQDAQDAAKAAQDLADAWSSVGDSIMDEVKRIRGLNDSASGGSFASLMGQFNAETALARGGDQDAAKSLPQLSQDLLNAANLAATSRQELDRIQAQIAASLEATYAAIMAAQGASIVPSPGGAASSMGIASVDSLAASAPPSAPTANDNLASEIAAMREELREELEKMRSDNAKGMATIAGNTGAMKRTLDNVTAASGGDAISTVAA